MTPLQVLVVDDEEGIRRGLCDLLVYHGYAVTGVATGHEALAQAQAVAYDLVILDIMLPDIDGYVVCQRMRADNLQQPIVMLTAKGAEEDVLRGFDVGADDYITKPFSVREVVARVQAIFRRVGVVAATADACFELGPWRVDPNTGMASLGEQRVELTVREQRLLRVFSNNPGRIVSRRLLLREVWGFDNPEAVVTRTVDIHIAKLRKKIGDCDKGLIQTVRGRGYRYGDDSA